MKTAREFVHDDLGDGWDADTLAVEARDREAMVLILRLAAMAVHCARDRDFLNALADETERGE